MSENSCFPVVVFCARDFQELLMSLDHEESTKPNQEDHNVGFIVFIIIFLNKFIYLFLVALGLRCCAGFL